MIFFQFKNIPHSIEDPFGSRVLQDEGGGGWNIFNLMCLVPFLEGRGGEQNPFKTHFLLLPKLEFFGGEGRLSLSNFIVLSKLSLD